MSFVNQPPANNTRGRNAGETVDKSGESAIVGQNTMEQKPILIWQGYLDPKCGMHTAGVYRIVGTPDGYDIEKEGKDRLDGVVWRLIPAADGPDGIVRILRDTVLSHAMWMLAQAVAGMIELRPR